MLASNTERRTAPEYPHDDVSTELDAAVSVMSYFSISLIELRSKVKADHDIKIKINIK